MQRQSWRWGSFLVIRPGFTVLYTGTGIRRQVIRKVPILMPSLHVLLKKEDLNAAHLQDRVVIVLDILFATSTMVHALAEGVDAIWPALDTDDANAVAHSVGDCLRSGEYLAEHLPGFAPAFPLLLSREPLRGRKLVYCTTNGTVALRASNDAPFAYVGALLNGAALVAHVRREHPNSSVLIVCSGSVGNFNLEDFYGAGHFVDLFEKQGSYELNDAARGAKLVRRGYDARTVLMNSRVGLMMQAKGLTNEVEYCAQLDILDVIARLDAGALRRVIS
jgi:2-phosphosulfolactate phosphatase